MFCLNAFRIVATILAVSSAYPIDPPTTAPSDTISDCTNWVVVTSSDTCAALASENFITLAQFNTYNPSVASKCALISGDSYCVEENFGIPPVPTSTSTSSTSTGNGVTTPGPIQTGVISNCNAFYLVKSGDACADIASSNGVSIDNFYAWNPAVGSKCNTLIAGDYVCVGIIGGVTSTITTKSGNGISTPGPIQTGMVGNCNSFYQVVDNDGCPSIASAKGITLAQFYAWNPAVGLTCTHLIIGDYVCVNIVGGTTIMTTTSSPTPTNGVSTPMPIQTGMVSNCNTFYLVQPNDECGTIASSHGISLANFYLWNPAVGSSCTYLDLGDYVCVNVIGGSTSTSVPTSTTPGNGIATPTPTQAGMWDSCSKWHLVASGDECGTIASAAGITLATFYAWNPAVGSSCKTLDVGYYVCIGGQVSTNGKCGSSASSPVNAMCIGSSYGDCCSVKGNCGKTPAFCATSNLCQNLFGTCTPASTDGKCGAASSIGATCLGSSNGGCCSVKGNCGSTAAFCATSNLCQPMYGTCTS